jgi:hypothetical protein
LCRRLSYKPEATTGVSVALSCPLYPSLLSSSFSKAAAMLGVSAFIPSDPFHQLAITLLVVGILIATVFVYALRPKTKGQPPSTLEAYLKFIYGCFLKPHTGDGSGSQQDALVRFKKRSQETVKLTNRRKVSTRLRPMSTMLLAFDFCVVAKTCWVWSLRS